MSLISSSVFLDIIILIFTWFGYLYYRFRTETSQFWAKRNIPHLSPVFLFGNGLEKVNKVSMGESSADYYNEHKNKKVLGYWALSKPVLAVFDMAIIKNILVRDFSYFVDRISGSYAAHDPLTGNLFNLEGQKWRNMRVTLTPTFTSGKMKMMYPVIEQCGMELNDFLSKPAANQEIVEVKDILARYTTNVIASCAFGIESNALKNPETEFRTYGKKIFELPTKQLILNTISFISPTIRNIFKIRQIPRDTSDFFIKIVKEVIEARTSQNVKRNDFMQLLIELINRGKINDVDKTVIVDESGQKFTIEEAAAQAFVFFAAGFESSSTNMTFTLYELAKNPEIQQKLRSEIKEALKKENGSLSYEAIMKLPYLDMVIQESLRKYPVIPVLFRYATKDYYFEEFKCTLPKGTLVIISLLGITKDPEIFPDPEKFDPLRFLPENIAKRDHYSSIPFGDGPRACIANRFGLLQTKVGLVSVLRDYIVDTCEKTAETLKFSPKSFVMTVEDGIHLKFRKD